MNILRDDQTRQYELTYLLPAAYTDAELSQVKEKIAQLLEKAQATAVKSQDWEKKSLAYTIKKGGKQHAEAFYVYVTFEALPAQVQKFERALYLEDAVIRHLLVVADKRHNGAAVTDTKSE